MIKFRRKFKFISVTIIVALVLSLFIFAGILSATEKNLPVNIDIVSRGLTFGLSHEKLNFGEANPGDLKSANNITLLAQSTEFDFNITVKGTDLTGPGTIPVSNIECRIGSNSWKKLSKTEEIIISGSPNREEQSFMAKFRVRVPETAFWGVHSGIITISINTL